MLTEVFKVVAPVEYLESLLMLTSSIDVLAQTGTPTYHLHELDFRPHLLEEHQVQHIGHVNTRIHHIHRHGYLRQLVTYFERINQRLCIVHLVVYQYTEISSVFGIKFTEALHYQFGMVVLLGKDDGLPDAFPALYPKSACHQVL